MDLQKFRVLQPVTVNRIRAEIDFLNGFPFQIAHINLMDNKDASAILALGEESLTIVSDRHSYHKKDRIFPINQEENTVFAQYVYRDSKNIRMKLAWTFALVVVLSQWHRRRLAHGRSLLLMLIPVQKGLLKRTIR
ncbi:MAG: hypothetical protein PHD95_04890 [Candidatus ainarchaeum sp.]|nr:hypothetical protein [Candidatus ainarchaeum sp.]